MVKTTNMISIFSRVKTLQTLKPRVNKGKKRKRTGIPVHNMRYLVFDVETTGLVPRGKVHPSRSALFPHIVQIGWMVVDNEAKTNRKFCAIIKPEGFDVPEDSTKCHGITDKQAKEEGLPLKPILEELQNEIKGVDRVIAHNAEFDSAVVAAECYRLRMADFLKCEKIYCTMKTTTDMCQLPGKYGYKYPKLGELYYHLFRKKPSEKLHNALEDVKVTQKCFEKLMTRHKDLKWKTVCRKPKVQIKRPAKVAKTN